MYLIFKDKMRHLLDTLHIDLQSPISASVTVLEQTEVDSSVLLGHKYSGFATLNKGTLFLDPDPVNGGDLHETTLRKEVENDLTEVNPVQMEKSTIMQSTELDYKVNNELPELTSPQPNEDEREKNNELVKEINELEQNMAVSLNLSDSYSPLETELEVSLKLSDDEF